MSDKPATTPLTAERMQAMLDGSPFIRFCGMRVAAIDPAAGRIVLAMELRPELERREGSGQWHGGALAGLIDTAGDFAVALGLGAVVPTINFRVDYLRPAMTARLTATATVRPPVLPQLVRMCERAGIAALSAFGLSKAAKQKPRVSGVLP